MRNISIVIMLIFTMNTATSQSTVQDGQKQRNNTIYFQNFIVIPSIYYDRVIPISETLLIIPRGGFGILEDGIIPIFGASAAIGNKKHKAEVGVAYWDFEGFLINADYRFTSRKGFFLKVGFEYIPGEEANPIIGLGYAF